MSIKTTSTGTTVRIDTTLEGEQFVILDNPSVAANMRDTEAGRVTVGHFQPAPFAAWAVSPEVLRAIADLIEEAAR